MELRSFIKLFTWEEGDRDRVTLGDGTRINPATHRAQLGSYDSDVYPTDDDLHVKSWVANPQAVRQWQGFEADVRHKRIDGETVTSAGFRLGDGTDEYYWDGGAWAVAGASDWNTEVEVAANISSFPATARKLQVVVNLKTTDSSATPELVCVKVLFGALLDDEIEDIVLRSLAPALEALRPVTRLDLKKAGADDKVKLGDYRIDTGYELLDVDAVFNETDDPDHNTDLYSSHTSNPDGTIDEITLTGAVADGKRLRLRMRYKPVVAVSTSRDYHEVEHVPSILIDSIVYSGRELWGEDHVGNKGDGTAKVIPAPLQGRLEFDMTGVAALLVDHLRLQKKVTEFFGANHTIVSTGLDESYRLWLVDEHEHRAVSNAEDLHSWRKTFRIEDFRVWARGVEDGYLVQRFKLTGDLNATVQ